MSLHEIGHAQNMALHGQPVHPDGARVIRELSKEPSLVSRATV
jgi:hypothetical protein